MTTTTFKPSPVNRIRELTKEIIAEENVLQMFLKLSPDLYCVVKQDYINRVNESWQRHLGWTQQECLEYPFTHFMHPDDVPTAMGHLSVASGETVQFVARMRLKNTDRFLPYTWNVAAGSDGNIYATARAITNQ